MDFWVFILAAAAGCLTKYLKKSSSRTLKGYNAAVDRNGCVDCLAHGINMVGDGFTSRTRVPDGKAMGSASSAEVPSTLGSNGMVPRDSEDFSLPSFASAPTKHAGDNTGFGEEDESTPHDILSSLSDGGAENFGSTCSFRRLVMGNATLTSRYCYVQVKPLTSLESCLLAQLYNDRMEQNVRAHSLHQTSTSSMARALHGNNGNKIISQRSDCLVWGQVSTESHLAENGNVIGVPPLPRIKKLQTTIRRNESSGISSSTVKRRKFSTQHGMMHGIIMFSLGIYTAVLSCVTRKETELDKLKELLKQSENLVQDLQEELEMKDSLIVKELSDDVYGSQFTRQTSFIAGAPASSFYEPREGNISKEVNNPRMDENVDSMSKIEAELEAELGRLGLNVRCCNIQLNKVDVSGRICAEDGSSSSSMAPSANYSVSPRALALRLHEVIQSRLEERIQELELALENSQRKVRLMESAQKSRSGRHFFNGVARPVVMNLSGEGLNTYDEACEEFVAFDSSEDNSPTYVNNYLPRSAKPNGTEEKPGVVSGRVPLESHETLSGQQEIDTFGMSRDESSDADDELLIRQLVERTKRGSPAVMKAQRLLFSDQDDPH